MKKSLFIIRWFLGAGCIAGAVLITHRAFDTDNLREAAVFAMVGIGVLIAGALLIAPATASPIAEFIGDCWGGIFFPKARFNKPPLSYTLADFYCRNRRHEEAVREHLKLIRHYPGERKSYLEVIAHCRALGATTMADRYEKRFRKRFGISKSRRMAGRCSVVAEKPENDGIPD